MQLAVRTSGRNNFPRVEKFVDLYDSGKLVKAEDSAKPVVDFAMSGSGDAFVQGRFEA